MWASGKRVFVYGCLSLCVCVYMHSVQSTFTGSRNSPNIHSVYGKHTRGHDAENKALKTIFIYMHVQWILKKKMNKKKRKKKE